MLLDSLRTMGLSHRLTDARSEYPRVVEVTLPAFDQQNLEVVIQIRQSGGALAGL
jgi:hypothetical protein